MSKLRSDEISIKSKNEYRDLLNLIYPVKSYFITEDQNFNPNNSFIGTWEQISEGYSLVAKGTTNHMGTTAGGYYPGGLPNITGDSGNAASNISLIANDQTRSGCFGISGVGSRKVVAGSSGNYSSGQLNINASRSSKRYGYHQAGLVSLHDQLSGDGGVVIPDFVAVFIWRRVS